MLRGYLEERQPGHQASTVVVRNWFNPNLNYQWFIVPSLIMIMSAVGGLIVSALSVAREREHGTFDQLLVSPLTPGLIMIGKTVPCLVVALSQATVVLAAAVFVFHVPLQGSLVVLYVCTAVFILSLSGIGLLISSVCATQQQAFLGVFSFLVPNLLLSGFFAPVENMPNWLQALTWFDPMKHFIVIVKGIFLKDMSAAAAWHETWPLLVIGVTSMTATSWIFRRNIA